MKEKENQSGGITLDKEDIFRLLREQKPNVIVNKGGIANMEGSNPVINNHFYNEKGETKKDVTPSDMPAELSTPEAQVLVKRFCAEGWLDESGKPAEGMSCAEKGILAFEMANALHISTQWKTFGAWWGIPPESLRQYYTRAMNQPKSGDFNKDVRHCISNK